MNADVSAEYQTEVTVLQCPYIHLNTVLDLADLQFG